MSLASGAVAAGSTGRAGHVMLLALACLVAAVQIQVRGVEEPNLLATHGPAYRAYAARAGRFLPGIGRLTGGPSRGGRLPG